MEIEPGKYRHFKGGEYEVIGIGRHSETLEELVFYRALYENKDFGAHSLWVRPVTLFTEKVVHNDEEVSRFKKI
tara:strand:- start:1597 stop:1818 length:222 start_codon:yes stop_codon:yes gene_type:complete